MNLQLLEDMRCPYSGGPFRVTHSVETQDGKLMYGLVSTPCFEFPVLNGVLLLSLAKGYGGAEEMLQPYVPLQVAALKYLSAGDLNGLQQWVRRHIPLLHTLLYGEPGDYLEFATKVETALKQETERYLNDQGRFEVLGAQRHRRPAWRKRLGAMRGRGSAQPPLEAQLSTFYGSRFFGPRTQALALQIAAQPLEGRLLSLCGGHGVFENVLRVQGKTEDLVCIDGQLLNLFIMQRYSNPHASYICTDVQFPLPFEDSYFQGVFSSTCLPEIPAQRSFAQEALRVSSSNGWTWFDSIWNLGSGVKRVDPTREYRFCQNFFESLTDYETMFAGLIHDGRALAADRPSAPRTYLQGTPWVADPQQRSKLVKDCDDAMVSFMVAKENSFDAGLSTTAPTWLNAETLRWSPAYKVTEQSADSVRLSLRDSMRHLNYYVAPADFGSYLESVTIRSEQLQSQSGLLDLYSKCLVSILPNHFWKDVKPIHS